MQTSKGSVFGNLQGDTLTYTDLTLNFLMDENLVIWKETLHKMLKMRDPNTTVGGQLEKYGYLEIHDDNSKEVLKLEFVNCMIESIDDMQFSTVQDDKIITYSVTIKYGHYNIVEKQYRLGSRQRRLELFSLHLKYINNIIRDIIYTLRTLSRAFRKVYIM